MPQRGGSPEIEAPRATPPNHTRGPPPMTIPPTATAIINSCDHDRRVGHPPRQNRACRPRRRRHPSCVRGAVVHAPPSAATARTRRMVEACGTTTPTPEPLEDRAAGVMGVLADRGE